MDTSRKSFKSIYPLSTEKLIRSEFKRVKEQTYLDHAGATLYSEKQIEAVCNDYKGNLFANPHARSTISKETDDAIDLIRYKILNHFNTDSNNYTVIFTSGTTAALKIIGESFHYNDGEFVYTEDNHTSVLGMREFANNHRVISFNESKDLLNKEDNQINCKFQNVKCNSLFVYPAQCNFSGFKYPLDWINKIKNGALGADANWYCMLDAASYASTNFLDLQKYTPDFICVSFYKMFGYPTGLGALLVKNQSSNVLNKKYFGGGTVYLALSDQNVVIRRKQLNESFEDGTLNFLSILSLKHGFDTIQRLNLNMDLISLHTFALAKYVYSSLETFQHNNSKPACVLYHDGNYDDASKQGAIVNFNVLRPDGSYVGYSEVMHIANLNKVYLRTGCFCNPGACKRHLQLTSEDVKYFYSQGHVCGDQNDLIDNRPTGSIRISFGYMSTVDDANAILDMIKQNFIVSKLKTTLANNNGQLICNTILKNERIKFEGNLKKILIYPIKSCGAFSIDTSWKLIGSGLEYDRQWMIVSCNGVCLTQKQEPKLCIIKPVIDLHDDSLILTCEGFSSVSVPLKTKSIVNCQSKVCGDRITGWDCGDEVADWLDHILCRNGLRLLSQRDIRKTKNELELSLANKAQFLMVNEASVKWLLDIISEGDLDDTLDDLVQRFRPNFVVNFGKIFVENDCESFHFGKTIFTSEGKCTRCQMICIDQKTGEKSVEPLRTLSNEFNGKITFGVYLKCTENKAENLIHIGDSVIGN